MPLGPFPNKEDTYDRAIIIEFNGDKKIFSYVGFLLVDDAQRSVLLGLYDKHGVLDFDKVELLKEKFYVKPWADGVEIVFQEGIVRDVILKNGYLIGLDHRFDDYVKKMSTVFDRRQPLPAIPMLPVK